MSFGASIAMKKAQWAHGRIWGKFLAAGALGILLGIFVTLIEIQRGNGFSAIEAGPWTGWPRSEASEIDPYTRAILAYSGEIALSESEAIGFVAYGDSDGAPFDSACDYLVEGGHTPCPLLDIDAALSGGRSHRQQSGPAGFHVKRTAAGKQWSIRNCPLPPCPAGQLAAFASHLEIHSRFALL